nr:FapA family protein [Lachnospiraceae bacterium]
ELRRILNENGVVQGIDDDFLIAMCKKKVYDREILVAQEVPAELGNDGYFKYRFTEDMVHTKPEIREDGSVDYSILSETINVKKGMTLAEYIPAKKGKAGIDVRGNATEVKPVKDLPSLKCKGVVQSEINPNLYLAETDGKVDFKDGKMEVNPVHEIHNDVDMVIGHVEFFGEVHIYGNVGSGVTIRAGKNLIVEGTVEAASLIAGGDIILRRGVQGNQKGKIACRGDLFADFIEHAQVKVGGNINASSIINSNVSAEGKIVCENKKGIILGGNVHGTAGVECKELGSDAAIKTYVHAGVAEEYYEKSRRYLKDEKDKRNAMEGLMEEFKEVEAMVRKLGIMSEDIERRVRQIKESQKRLDEEMKEIRSNRSEVLAYIEKNKNALIRVKGKVYVGSSVNINISHLEVLNDNMFMEYRDISGMIAGSVLAV